MLRIHLKVEKVEEFLEIISRKLEIGIYGCESKAKEFRFFVDANLFGSKNLSRIVGKNFYWNTGWLID